MPSSLRKSRSVTALIMREHACFSSSRSKAAFIFLNILAPTNRDCTGLLRITAPSHISARKPATLPSLATKEKPSPLFSFIFLFCSLRVTTALSRLMAVTVPISSPIDLAASIAAHLPLRPSMKSSVYPLLNVFAVSGVKPPETVPKDPLS